MTERFTDEDLARIEANPTVAFDVDEIRALVAEVRELRAEVKHIDDANTALGSQVIDLMRERDEARQALRGLDLRVWPSWKDTDTVSIRVKAGAVRRAAEALGGE
jgi:cell division septum initiation protein DivIVA